MLITFWYIFLMHQETDQSAIIYEFRLKTLLPATTAVFIAAIILNSQSLLLQLPGPALLTAVFVLLLITTCLSARFLTYRLTEWRNLDYPTVTLWLYPTLAMFMITAGAYAFLALSNHYGGRGFWSASLGLTGQDTTSLFFTCFASMLIFISLQFLTSVFSVFCWIIDVSKAHLEIAAGVDLQSGNHAQIGSVFEQIRNHNDMLREKRTRATSLNRLALLSIFLLAASFASWVTFFRPELILYYRAEVQLRTFREPLTAYETFRHLSEKYPQYRFIDSVMYRMAWILDRRLNEFARARESYEQFISRFGYHNVWSDEAMTSLVRLSLDHLNNPQQTLAWSEAYLRTNPNGIMAPHMYLYRIRAFNQLKQPEKAIDEANRARQLFSEQKIQVINSEDRLISLVDFSEAIAAENQPDKKNINAVSQ